MNLALLGYGKMGKMIDGLAPEYGFAVTHRLDEHNNVNQSAMTVDNFKDVNVAIDFSTPEVCLANIQRLASLKINTVVGTTGWLNQMDDVKAMVAAAHTGFVWSPNYSIGVNVFFRLIHEAARLLADEKEYGAWAWEIHHHTKLDSPSGTLLKLVSEMQQAGYQRPIDVSSNRAGAHPGTHEIGFDSAADTITIKHAARSREGFARGALKAAQWIAGKRGFYEFRETLFPK